MRTLSCASALTCGRLGARGCEVLTSTLALTMPFCVLPLGGLSPIGTGDSCALLSVCARCPLVGQHRLALFADADGIDDPLVQTLMVLLIWKPQLPYAVC